MFRTLRKFGMVAAAAMLAAGGTGAALAADAGSGKNARILIVYYSHSGNTKGIAERLQKKLGGVLHSVEPVEEYPAEYQAVLEKSRPQVEAGFKPELKGELPDMGDFDLLLVGGPVWFGTLAPPLSSFMAQAKLEGKTIAPFCTFGGGIRNYFARFKEACPKDAMVLEGFGLGRADLAKDEAELDKLVGEWAAKLPKATAE